MQYSLTNSDGVVVREASGTPVTYLHGAGRIPLRLEQELDSHKIGDIVTAKLLPEDAFGKCEVDLLHEVPANEIPGSDKIEVGGQLTGSDDEQNEVVFTITAIKDGMISLDGNHPLAGQTLIFEVEIQAIRNATDDELRTGVAVAFGARSGL